MLAVAFYLFAALAYFHGLVKICMLILLLGTRPFHSALLSCGVDPDTHSISFVSRLEFSTRPAWQQIILICVFLPQQMRANFLQVPPRLEAHGSIS
jgi:hypothetical protein